MNLRQFFFVWLLSFLSIQTIFSQTEFPEIKISKSEFIPGLKSFLGNFIEIEDNKYLGYSRQYVSRSRANVIGGKKSSLMIFDSELNVLNIRTIEIDKVCKKCDVSDIFVFGNEVYLTAINFKNDLIQWHEIDLVTLEILPSSYEMEWSENQLTKNHYSEECDCLIVVSYPKESRNLYRDGFNFSVKVFEKSFQLLFESEQEFKDDVYEVWIYDIYVTSTGKAFVTFKMEVEGERLVTPPDGRKIKDELVTSNSYIVDIRANSIKEFDLDLPNGIIPQVYWLLPGSNDELWISGLYSNTDGLHVPKKIIKNISDSYVLWTRGTFNQLLSSDNFNKKNTKLNPFSEELFKTKLTGRDLANAKRKGEPTFVEHEGLSDCLNISMQNFNNSQYSMLFEEGKTVFTTTHNSKGSVRTNSLNHIWTGYLELYNEEGEIKDRIELDKHDVGTLEFPFSNYFIIDEFVHFLFMDNRKLKLASVDINTKEEKIKTFSSRRDAYQIGFPENTIQISKNELLISVFGKEGTQLIKIEID